MVDVKLMLQTHFRKPLVSHTLMTYCSLKLLTLYWIFYGVELILLPVNRTYDIEFIIASRVECALIYSCDIEIYIIQHSDLPIIR